MEVSIQKRTLVWRFAAQLSANGKTGRWREWAEGEPVAAPMGKWPLRTNMRFGRRPNASKKQQGRSGLAGYAHVLPQAKREAANRLAKMLA
jgi:hypothetical protein